MCDEMIMEKESRISGRRKRLQSISTGQERTRAERAERLFAERKLSSDFANVMKRDARNSATVSAVAPRFNSSAWRARISFFLTLSLSLSLSLSIYLCRWHDGTRFVVTLYAARATPRRSFCRWQLRDTKWAAHSVSHACRGFDARIARSTGPGPPGGRCRAGVARRSHETVTWHADVTPSEHGPPSD